MGNLTCKFTSIASDIMESKASSSSCSHLQCKRSRRSRHTRADSPHLDISIESSDVSNDEILDLTEYHSRSVSDSTSETVLSGEDVVQGPVRRKRKIRRRGKHQTNSRQTSYVHTFSEESDSDGLPALPFEFIPPSIENKETQRSPEGVKISCPVCLDDTKQIRHSGRQVMSTTCGHIFCDTCIKEAIKVQHACPSCRKKLTRQSIHPLFL